MKSLLTFIGANAHSGASDYDTDSKLVAFASKHLISLWSPFSADGTYSEDSCVHKTLKLHSAEVLNVRFISSSVLALGAEDGTVKIWRKEGNEFQLSQTLGQHAGSVCAMTVFEGMLCCGFTDGKIVLWASKDDQFEQVMTLELPDGVYALSLALVRVDLASVALFVGATSVKIITYVLNLETLTSRRTEDLPGHENWVQTLSVTHQSPSEVLLALGLLDRLIRLWKVNFGKIPESNDEDELLTTKKYDLGVCYVSFDALLLGHDDWVLCVRWDAKGQVLMLTSSDTSMMLWEADLGSGVWTPVTRLGELSIKGASTATGALGGFWSALWAPGSTEAVMTHGKTGAWRVWTREQGGSWQPRAAPLGPAGPVTDVVFLHLKDYFLVTLLDQTTRLYAYLGVWSEWARPQIHGYDMICASGMPDNATFVSAGDEKVMRVFQMPAKIATSLKDHCGVRFETSVELLPAAAELPTLGLLNKLEHGDVVDESLDGLGREYDGSLRPLEEDLQRVTLFPELEKIYGHGYEILALAASHKGDLVVLCCKSNSRRHAVIRIYDTKTWLEVARLEHHDLTVTRLCFSSDDQYLVSVGRDRKIAVWKREPEGLSYALHKDIVKGHLRIIWDACFVGDRFCTALRDKSVALWTVDGENIWRSKLGEAVTTVAWLGSGSNGVFAVGLDSGKILTALGGKEGAEDEFKEIGEAGGRVRRLAWGGEGLGGGKAGGEVLVAASEDSSVRIFGV